MTLTADLRVFELLASRLCHDIVGPIGAVNNGMELLEDDNDADMAADAIELVAASACQAANSLQFYRLAYGMTGTQLDANGPELAKLAGAFLERTKTRLDWPNGALPDELPEGFAKLLMNLVALAAESLPRGGTVALSFAEEGAGLRLAAQARGEGCGLKPEVAAALAEDCEVAELTPRGVQGYFTRLLAQRAGGSLQATPSGDAGYDFIIELPGK
jgi:histidine phosphotransferase ChpT